MTISKRKLTAFSRWMNRFHRSKGLESPIYYLTRSTFDLMRLTTEERSESDIALKIREVIRSIGEGTPEMPHSRFSMWGNNCVLVPSIPDPGDSERDLGGMIAMRAEEGSEYVSMGDFDGEHDFDDVPIVILHHGKWAEVEADQGCGLAESLFQGGAPELDSPIDDMRINDFEGSMVKLGPTEILMRGDGVEDALDLIKCQISEVRVSDDPEAISREQSESMNLVRVVDSPAINLTGRPGTGKTTVAQITVPEVLLQRGPRRFERNVLYLTTTNELKSEARTEIDNIIQHVYGVKGSQYERVDEQITDHVEYLTRDNLISSHPSDRESLDLAIDQIAEDALGLSHGEVGVIKKKWTSIQENWLVPERRSELRRVLSNLVFGLFGSKEVFASWFNRNLENHKAEGVWRKIFSGTKLNLYEPWKTEFDPQQEDVSRIEEEKIHPNLLEDFWNPFLGVDYKTGMDRIESLTTLVGLPEIGGRIFGSDGSGHWTHASIMHKLDVDIESGRVKGKGIWSGENQNKFDAIVIDESQDFTVRELSIVLKRFANRGVTKKAEANAKDYAPFLFLASGDPLQTIEGSLFGPRNTHINNLYEDWKVSIRESTRENPIIDIEADVQLNNMMHKELRANHRNAQPIVEYAVNPIISKMKSDAHDQLGIVRTIYDQTAASSRRGFLLRWEDEEIEKDRDKRYAENIWRISTERVIQQIDSIIESQDTVSKKVTVGLILPVEDMANEEEVIGAIPEKLADGRVREKVRELFGKMAPGHENRKWNEKTMSRAGIFNVSSIKGLTLECTIAAGFGDRVQQDVGPYEKMTRYSHYLVACSRPQFVLLLYEEGKHPDIPGMESSLFRKDDDVDDEGELVDLRNLLNRVEVNLDPTILLDDALQYPESKKFWDLTINSLEALREKKGEWGEAIQLVSFLEEMNRRFHQKRPRFITARNIVSEVLDGDARTRLSVGAKSLRRPELVTPNGSDQDPLAMIRAYIDWRAFLNDEQSTPAFLSDLDTSARNWAKIANDGPEEKVLRGIIKSERTRRGESFLFHPDWSGKSLKGVPKRPEHQDCVVNIEIPEKYLFRDEKFPMVQPNVWSTPYDLLRGLIDRFREKELPSYGEYSDEDWKREDWGGLTDLEERLLDVEWYLTASRNPEELVEIILREKKGDEQRAISGVDWIFDILSRGIRTEDESEKDENLSNAVKRWAGRERGRGQLVELFRGWIDRKGLEVYPGGTTTVLDEFEEVMGVDLLKSIFTDKDSKEWVTGLISWIITSLSGEVEFKRASREYQWEDSGVSMDDAVLLLNKIQRLAIDENLKYCKTILALLKPIQRGKGSEVKEWLTGGSLEYLEKFNGKSPDVTEAAISVFIRFGLNNPVILSEMYSRWFGSRLGNVWSEGKWKDKSARDVIEMFIRLTGGPGGQKRDKKLIGGGLSEHVANVLSSAVEPKLVTFSEELFEDCVEAGGVPSTGDHMVLKYFLWLNLPKSERRSSRVDPFGLYEFVDSNAKSGKPDLSKVYREGHNYWNGLTTKDDFTAEGSSLIITCEDRHRRQVRRTMLGRNMISETVGGVTEFGLREDRVAPPSEIIENGRKVFTQFSNTNPAIQGYLSIRPNGNNMGIEALKDCHWNFRLAGAYREAAIASLCEGVILAMNPGKADGRAIFDFLNFHELEKRVERSLRRARRDGPVANPGEFRKRARKAEKGKLTRSFKELSDSEKRRVLVMKSLRNAIDERPGAYIDHVMVTRNWARKTSNKFESLRFSLRDSTTKRLFLRVKDDSIIPIGMKPIGYQNREGYQGLSILEDETKKELGEMIDGSRDNLTDRGTVTESQVFSAGSQRRFSCRKDKEHSEIRKLYKDLLSSMRPYQAIGELPLITGEKRVDIEAKPAKIVSSTRRLIPYVLLAEEADRDFKKIDSVTWFKAPKNPTDFEFWEGDDILEDLSREDVIDILSEEGDAWIFEIFNLVRGIDTAGEWGQSEILDLQAAIIKSAPTEGLRRMSEAILIGKTSS